MKDKLMLMTIWAGVFLGAQAQAQNNPSIQWQSAYSEEFKDDSWRQNWTILQKNSDNMGQEHMAYHADNVALVEGNYLQLKTRRHCVNSIADALSDANASERPCPSGKLTRYQSGRVHSGKVVDGSKPFRAEIRAKINWNGKQGTRPALWLRNSVNLQNCHRNPNANDPYGELDIVEWYSYMPAYTWSSSHITCHHNPSTQTWKTRGFNHSLENRGGTPDKPIPLSQDWHVWTVEYDGNTVKYFVDDQVNTVYSYRASDSDRGSTERVAAVEFSKLNTDPDVIAKTFNDNWYFILNDYVEIKEEQRPPKADEDFPEQTFLIDYVRLYKPAETPPAGARAHQKYAPIDTNYPVPDKNVLWVSPAGNDSAAGTQSAPMQTVQAALRRAESGSTIVLKSGAYREPHFFLTEDKANLTLQAEPHGDVWFKGSDVVPAERWEKEGNLWKTTGNFYNFCQVCSTHPDPNFDGIASKVEQVFINDEPLRQVASKAEVVSGTFYVEDPNPTTLVDPKDNRKGFNMGSQDVVTYYLGSDPTRGITEISQRPRAFTSVSRGLKVLGINFAHYSPHQRWDYNDPVHGYNAGAVSVSLNRDNNLVENGIFTQNTNTALFVMGKGATIRHNRFIENGANGFGNNNGDNALIEHNYFANNNTSGHKTDGTLCTDWCIIGHLKMTHAHNLTFRNNIIDDSAISVERRMPGYWCDEGCINAIVTNNFFTNQGTAIFYEVSDRAIIASNIIENSGEGIAVAGSSNVRIYNNTLSRTHHPIVLKEDARFDGCHNADCSRYDEWSRTHKLSWDNSHIEIYNNILSSRTLRRADEAWWPYIIITGRDNRDGKRRIYSNEQLRGLDYNAYYRESLAKEPNLITFDLPGERESIDLIFTRAHELGSHARVSRQINGLERQALDLLGRRESNPYFIKEAAGDLAFLQSNYHLRADSPARGSGKALPIDVLRAIDPQRNFLNPGKAVDRGALANVLFDATNGKARTLARLSSVDTSASGNNSHTVSSEGTLARTGTPAIVQTRAPTLSRQNLPTLQSKSFSYEQKRPASEGKSAVAQNGQWGFVNERGQEIIAPQYEAVWEFREGLAAVKQDGQWGYIDMFGRMVIRPQYDSALTFGEGRAAVQKNGRWGFVDNAGREVIAPRFDKVWPFHKGTATVMNQGVYRQIDRNGQVISPQNTQK